MRTDLKMRKGKMVAQGAHASMKVLLDMGSIMKQDPLTGVEIGAIFSADVEGPMQMWVEDIFTKVCCRVESEEELDAVYEKAKEAGLLCVMIVDAGKTEFNGVPTKTCCAIGPALPEDLDPITGHLKLL